MYNVVHISLSLRYKIDIYVKMYVVWTENSKNIVILSEKEIKMAAEIQDVCRKLTDSDFTYQRFCSEQVYSISGYQQAFFRICAQYNNTA